MIVTEEEAKTKRCQESFGPGLWTTPEGRAMPRVSDDQVLVVTSPSRCIGSACMAWRWRGGMGDQEKGTGILLGYCGKAGRP